MMPFPEISPHPSKSTYSKPRHDRLKKVEAQVTLPLENRTIRDPKPADIAQQQITRITDITSILLKALTIYWARTTSGERVKNNILGEFT